MTIAKFLGYIDLVEAGIINNRVTLNRLIKTQQFPPGRLLGPNTRAWEEKEIELWLASRPVKQAVPREKRLGAYSVADKDTSQAKPSKRGGRK
jgi:Prophage CP4-57 regulatory protein (AlpA)